MAVTEAGKRELFVKRMTEEMGITIDETIGGLALIVLGILALVKIDPPLLNSIATIIAGVALSVVSAGRAVELSRALSESTGRTMNTAELSSGVNAGMLGGIVGIVLGVLAILNVVRPTLIAVALIVFGASVLFDFIASVQVRALQMLNGAAPVQTSWPTAPIVWSANSGTMLAGIALITLGILALSGASGEILVTVALLSLGGYLLLEASTVFGRMMLRTTGRSGS